MLASCVRVPGTSRGPGPFPSSTPEGPKLNNSEGADDSIADVDDEIRGIVARDWSVDVEASSEAEAIAKGAEEFKQPRERLIAVRR